MNKISTFKGFFRKSAIASCFLFSHGSGAASWSVKDPFDFKVFVVNKGQFSAPAEDDTLIAFGTSTGGATYLFGSRGFYIVRYIPGQEENAMERMPVKANEKRQEREEEEKERRPLVAVYEEFRWLHANPEVKIIPEEQAAGYFSYPDLDRSQRTRSLQAIAYKKILYKDIFPGIDAEFQFPADSSGIKYTLFLHPGADLSLVRFSYVHATKCRILSTGDVAVSSPVGQIIEHAPVAFSLGEVKEIPCSFTSLKPPGCLGFTSNKNNNLVIDPWIQVPTFGSGNKAFDVDYDDSGNVYTMGGNTYSFSLLKYDSTGNLLWSFALPVSNNYCGDFAVDRMTGIVYVTEGFSGGNPANVYKISPGGALITSTSSSVMNEMWRVAFSSYSRQGVIAGGGTFDNYQACYLDTPVASITPKNVLNVTSGLHDFSCLALDDSGYCYMLLSKSAYGTPTPYDNCILKMPLPGLNSMVFSVPSGYKFVEAASTVYNGLNPYANGYNGLCVSGLTLFTYDGYTLMERNAMTGMLVHSRFVNYIADSSLHYWGGITSNHCLDVFIGDRDSIARYDSSLKRLSAIPAPDKVFDVMLGKNGNLYACGDGFVMSTQVPVNCCSTGAPPLTVQVAGNVCDSLPTVHVTLTGGVPPFSVSWSTTPPQYGDTAYNLLPGNYSVTVTDSSCAASSSAALFTVPPQLPRISIVAVDPCTGTSSSSITVHATGGDTSHTYLYSWDTNPIQQGLLLQGLPPGTYTLTVADSLCNKSYPVILNSALGSIPDTGIANVFTPNGDGFNDVYYPLSAGGNSSMSVSSFHLVIFNRWGLKLFETNDISRGWSGKNAGGKPYPSGIYYYALEFDSPCLGGDTFRKSGFVHLYGD